MKLAFSTKGWHGVSWEEFVFDAHDLGFDGIEIHNLRAPEFSRKCCPADLKTSGATYRDLFDKKLSVPCIDTTFDMTDGADTEGKIAEIGFCLEVAKGLHVPYVRIHAVKSEGEGNVRDIIHAALPTAEEAGIALIIETMGVYADTAKLRALLDEYASDYLGVLWDVHYPYRENGESPQTSITNLGAYIKHVHVRDSVMGGGYELIGEGDMPIAEFMLALDSVNYDGFVTLEWDPSWMEELDDRMVILSHFVN